MIFGIGTDIVRVDRMRGNLERYGDKFARRILTEDEFREFSATAMGTGFSDGMSLRHIGVAHDGKGRPLLVYNGRAEQLRREMGIGEGHLSIADEQDYAVAFVTLLVKEAS